MFTHGGLTWCPFIIHGFFKQRMGLERITREDVRFYDHFATMFLINVNNIKMYVFG